MRKNILQYEKYKKDKTMVGWEVHRLTNIHSNGIWSNEFFFLIYLTSSDLHSYSFDIVQYLDPIVKKVNRRYDVILWTFPLTLVGMYTIIIIIIIISRW